MGVITFSDSDEATWYVASWVFRQLLDDVTRNYPNDTEMVEKFEEAKLYSGLILYLLEGSFADRIKHAITTVAAGILNGSIQSGIGEQPYGDATTVEQYLDSLKELIRISSVSSE